MGLPRLLTSPLTVIAVHQPRLVLVSETGVIFDISAVVHFAADVSCDHSSVDFLGTCPSGL